MDHNDTISLEDLNEEEASKRLGALVFVSILMPLGVIGNLHILLIYGLRIKPSNHRIYIMTMAGLDFIMCAVLMPTAILSLRDPLLNSNVLTCRILFFINIFVCHASALLLCVISIDRYRKICTPHGKQFTRRNAGQLTVLSMGVATLVTWPVLVLNGHRTKHFQPYNVTAVVCRVSGELRNTPYPVLYSGFQFVALFAIFTIMSVCYYRILKVIKKLKATKDSPVFRMKSARVKAVNEVKEDTYSTEADDTSGDINATATSPTNDANSANNIGAGFKTGSPKHVRLTYIFSLMTVVFLFSYAPYLILRIATLLHKDFVGNMTHGSRVVFHIFFSFYFVNYIANIFLYGLFDKRLRKELKGFYANIYRRYRIRNS